MAPSPYDPPALLVLRSYNIDSKNGFLPDPRPLRRLPETYRIWDETVAQLPKLLAAGCVRDAIGSIPLLDASKLENEQELSRAMLLLSYLAHAYVWGDSLVKDTIPINIAVPWYQVGSALGRPPVLSYASHALYNWSLIDPQGKIELSNLMRLENFLGGLDEDWFVLVHVEIEAKAGPALLAMVEAKKAVLADNTEHLEQQLNTITEVLRQMLKTLMRMTEKCDPYIYYTRVRPYIFGWKDNPALPRGMQYEGVLAYSDQPRKFRGETGAQSSIIPSVDATLGFRCDDDPLSHHLLELRDYMPPKHREFISLLEKGPSVRDCVLQNRFTRPSMAEAYNACVLASKDFRGKHLEYAGLYIHSQSQRVESNPVEVGTGGTPFMGYLKKHRDDLESYLIA